MYQGELIGVDLRSCFFSKLYAVLMATPILAEEGDGHPLSSCLSRREMATCRAVTNQDSIAIVKSFAALLVTISFETQREVATCRF
jgi:hypothetical protein